MRYHWWRSMMLIHASGVASGQKVLTLELPSRSHKVSGTSFGNYDEGKYSERTNIYLNFDFQKLKKQYSGSFVEFLVQC
jgi:hypothetical protein